MAQTRSLELYKNMTAKMPQNQKRYRLMGVMIFTIACGLLAVRSIINIAANALYKRVQQGRMSEVMFENLTDTMFSLVLQIGVLVIVPVLFYKFAFKMKRKEMLAFSNFKKTAWYNYILAIAIGITGLFVTTGISAVWQVIIQILGYTHSSSASVHPQQFNFFLFLLSIFLTAVLPGFCEEVAMRGGYLTTMRKSFNFKTTVLIMGLSFGLFHQYITQVFYTMLFGILMGVLTLKTKSIFPAMIVHFFNNGTSVYLDYASTYGWFGGGYYDFIDNSLRNSFFGLFMLYLVICSIFAGLILLFLHLNSAQRLGRKKELIQSSGFDKTNNRVVLVGEENKKLVKDLNMDKEVYGSDLAEELYKPTLRDNAFYIGAAAVAVFTTVFTFVWGWVM